MTTAPSSSATGLWSRCGRRSLARRRPPPFRCPALYSCATRRSAHGARCAQDVGAGRVVGFTRAMIGASSHVLQLEHEGHVRQVSVKLRRKNNGETEWYIKPNGYRHVAPGSAAIAGAQPAQSPAAAAAPAPAPATAARAEATHSSAAMEQASELALAQRRRPHRCAGTIQLVNNVSNRQGRETCRTLLIYTHAYAYALCACVCVCVCACVCVCVLRDLGSQNWWCCCRSAKARPTRSWRLRA